MNDATRSALQLLIEEKDRIERAIQILQGTAPRRGRPPGTATAKAAKKRGRKSMSPEARKAQSERMKAYWAARRAEKAKASKKKS